MTRLTKADRAAAALTLKLLAQPPGPTPQRRLRWRQDGAALGQPVLEMAAAPPTPAEMRNLAKDARYNASEKGRARAARYLQSPQRQAAVRRQTVKRRQAADLRDDALLAALQVKLDALNARLAAPKVTPKARGGA
jgi:hypothetical protein